MIPFVISNELQEYILFWRGTLIGLSLEEAREYADEMDAEEENERLMESMYPC